MVVPAPNTTFRYINFSLQVLVPGKGTGTSREEGWRQNMVFGSVNISYGYVAGTPGRNSTGHHISTSTKGTVLAKLLKFLKMLDLLLVRRLAELNSPRL
jgi:hypothetical protein